jgi:opacity protein-like surface antigen
MKGILARLISTSAALVLVAAPLSAQGGFMLGGGLTLPQKDYADQVKDGWHGMVGLDLPLSGPLGLRVDGAYHLNAIDIPGDLDMDAALIAVSGNGVFHFGSGGVSPYVMGGVTWASIKCTGDDCIDTSSQSDVGYNIGGGLQFSSLFLEARYVSISGDVEADFVPITIGFHF